jgi:hypothetical protein
MEERHDIAWWAGYLGGTIVNVLSDLRDTKEFLEQGLIKQGIKKLDSAIDTLFRVHEEYEKWKKEEFGGD